MHPVSPASGAKESARKDCNVATRRNNHRNLSKLLKSVTSHPRVSRTGPRAGYYDAVRDSVCQEA